MICRLASSSLALAGALTLTLGLLAPTTDARAADLVVTTLDDVVASDGACSLREAILAANADAAIDVTAGECQGTGFGDDTVTFAVDGTITLSASLPDIADAATAGTLRLEGPVEATSQVAIDGDAAHRVLRLASGADLVVEDLTVQNGRAGSGGLGGGILAEAGSALTIRRSLLTGNQADGGSGGAIFVRDGTSTLTIEDSIFDQNAADSLGGAIVNDRSAASITGSIFTANQARGGAAISHDSSSPFDIADSSFSGNTTLESPSPSAGGALRIRGTGETQIAGTMFSDNEAVSGGAISIVGVGGSLEIRESFFSGNLGIRFSGGLHNDGADIEIIDTTMDGNQVRGLGNMSSGGAILHLLGSMNIRRSTLSNNVSDGAGGAIELDDGPNTLVLENVTLAGNRSGNVGGGLHVSNNPPTEVTLRNVTVVGNHASVSGGGISGGATSGTTIAAGNSIIGDNTAGEMGSENLSGVVMSLGHNLLSDASLSSPQSSDILNGTLDLGPLANNGGPTRTLEPGSASDALRNGDTTLAIDQRGVPRPQNGTDDIGAVEVETAPPHVMVDQAPGQEDPTSSAPIRFLATFSEPIYRPSFEPSDIVISGSAPGDLEVVISEAPPFDGTTFELAVSQPSGSGSVTVGIPEDAVEDFAGNGNQASTSADDTVIFQPVADLSIRKDNGRSFVEPGDFVTYTIEVTNDGPSDVFGAEVVDLFPQELIDCSWRCLGGEGVDCTAGPVAGDLFDVLDLAAGVTATYLAECQVDPDIDPATEEITNTASVSAPIGVDDPSSANDSATDTDWGPGAILFIDGFESGNTGAWSSAS